MTKQDLIDYCYEHYPLSLYPESLDDIPDDIFNDALKSIINNVYYAGIGIEVNNDQRKSIKRS